MEVNASDCDLAAYLYRIHMLIYAYGATAVILIIVIIYIYICLFISTIVDKVHEVPSTVAIQLLHHCRQWIMIENM